MMVDMIFCQIVPESGPIRLVTVLGQDETIKGLSFALEGVQVGHLAQRWGRPDAVQKGRGFAVTRWGNHMQATAQTFGWFTYQAGVDLVVMRDEEHNTAAQIH